MRVLWVTPQRPNPRAGAGEVLEFELLRYAAKRHTVHLISSAMTPDHADADLNSIGVSYEGVSWTRTPEPRNRLALLWRLATKDAGEAVWAQTERIAALSEVFTERQGEYRPEFVQVVMSEVAPLLDLAVRPRALIVFDALERHMRQEVAQAQRLRDRLLWTLQLRNVRRWERRWYVLADRIACNSVADAEALSSVIGRPVGVVPNIVPAAFYASAEVQRSTDRVAFIATLSYRPNVDAVLWLTREIWPLVLRRRPDAKLVIVGRHPLTEIVRAAREVGATIEGDVPDVRPYYWMAAAVVAPIRLGSGLRNKILHAMACEAPLVATSTALEGLDVEAGQQLLVANDAQGIADAIVDTLNDPEAARARSRRARDFVDRFRSDAVAQALDAWWETT